MRLVKYDKIIGTSSRPLDIRMYREVSDNFLGVKFTSDKLDYLLKFDTLPELRHFMSIGASLEQLWRRNHPFPEPSAAYRPPNA